MNEPSRKAPMSMDAILEIPEGEYGQYDEFCYQGSVSAKRLIRHMIRVLNTELEWRGREDSMSLRGLWYSGVKTALQRAFPEKWDDPGFDANRRFSQYLSETLSEMVKSGEVTYRELNIVDDSRQREIATDSLEDDKILFVEKEAAYRRLEPIQETFKLSLVSGGGWEATALIEDMANNLTDGQTYSLYVLTDFDPTGYSIAADFRRRAEQLGANIETVQRIGIEPDQVSDEVRNQERFEVPIENESDQEWLERYGIDGKYGLEIEAIGGRGEGGAPLRRIVVNAIEDDLQLRDRRRNDLSVEVANVSAGATDTVVDGIVSDLDARVREWACQRVSEQEGVTSCRVADSEEGTVSGLVEYDALDGDRGELVPEPRSRDYYLEAAIEGYDALRPDSENEREQLVEEIETAIQEGEIDLEALLNME